jgi:hypothetical protein
MSLESDELVRSPRVETVYHDIGCDQSQLHICVFRSNTLGSNPSNIPGSAKKSWGTDTVEYNNARPLAEIAEYEASNSNFSV